MVFHASAVESIATSEPEPPHDARAATRSAVTRAVLRRPRTSWTACMTAMMHQTLDPQLGFQGIADALTCRCQGAPLMPMSGSTPDKMRRGEGWVRRGARAAGIPHRLRHRDDHKPGRGLRRGV